LPKVPAAAEFRDKITLKTINYEQWLISHQKNADNVCVFCFSFMDELCFVGEFFGVPAKAFFRDT